MQELQKTRKKVEKIIGDAQSEIAENQRQIDKLYEENDRLQGLPEEAARMGDEQKYKDLRLHFEFIGDRISQLEQRNDRLENEPLVTRAEHDKLEKTIVDEYHKTQRQAACEFLKAVEMLRDAQDKIEAARSEGNALLWRLNDQLYWADAVTVDGQKIREPVGVQRIPVDDMTAAIVDLLSGDAVSEAEKLTEIGTLNFCPNSDECHVSEAEKLTEIGTEKGC